MVRKCFDIAMNGMGPMGRLSLWLRPGTSAVGAPVRGDFHPRRKGALTIHAMAAHMQDGTTEPLAAAGQLGHRHLHVRRKPPAGNQNSRHIVLAMQFTCASSGVDDCSLAFTVAPAPLGTPCLHVPQAAAWQHTRKRISLAAPPHFRAVAT